MILDFYLLGVNDAVVVWWKMLRSDQSSPCMSAAEDPPGPGLLPAKGREKLPLVRRDTGDGALPSIVFTSIAGLRLDRLNHTLGSLWPVSWLSSEKVRRGLGERCSRGPPRSDSWLALGCELSIVQAKGNRQFSKAPNGVYGMVGLNALISRSGGYSNDGRKVNTF